MQRELAFAYSGVVLLATVISGSMVHADISKNHQDQHKFSDVFLAIKPGGVVTFSNLDGVVHNIVSLSPEYGVNLGELNPGVSKTLLFNRKGVVDLGCSKHPEMKMTIFVRKPAATPAIEDPDSTKHTATINLLSSS
jgi:plastocyanin